MNTFISRTVRRFISATSLAIRQAGAPEVFLSLILKMAAGVSKMEGGLYQCLLKPFERQSDGHLGHRLCCTQNMLQITFVKISRLSKSVYFVPRSCVSRRSYNIKAIASGFTLMPRFTSRRLESVNRYQL